MPNYGYPKDATSRLRELTLKGLPEPVRYVRSGHDKPALYVHGPLKEDEPVQEAPKAVPTDVHYQKGSRQVAFHFDPPLSEGEYQVVVHASRIRADIDGQDEPMPLVGEGGRPWSGYRLTVVEDGVEAGGGGSVAPEGGRQTDESSSSAKSSYEVRLDGDRVPSGESGLSGRRLEIEGPADAQPKLVVSPLARNAALPLYSRYVQRTTRADSGGTATHYWESSGPIGNSAWAAFNGRRTEGVMLPRKVLGAIAVTRGPSEVGGTVQFDLPVNSQVEVQVRGETVWWGQTRMLPLLLTPRRFSFLSGNDHPADAKLEAQIWRASKEALGHWGCSLPDYIPETMEAYILARLEHGWPQGGGYSGSVRVRLGDQTFEGNLDRSVKRRLQAISEQLKDCETATDMFGEDTLPAGHAKLASKARPGFYPRRSGQADRSKKSLYYPQEDEFGRP